MKRGAEYHPARFRWTPALLRLLGRMPDVDVASRARVNPATVRLERRRRGIGVFDGRRGVIEWTEPMLSLLGTDTDANVAAELGIHPASVSWRRRRLHIPAFGPGGHGPRSRIRWSARALSLLGTAPDEQVAKRLHLTWAVVIRKRHELEIPSFVPAAPRIKWAPAALRLLGRQPDRDLARKLGLRAANVKSKREELRIPPYKYSGPVARTRRLKALLAHPADELRRRHGLTPSLVRKLRREYGVPSGVRRGRWTAEVLRRLGKEPDTSIARELGISSPSVLSKRRGLGIARYDPRRRWTPAERRWLGRIPDAEVARRLAISVNVVRTERRRLGIAAYRYVSPILRRKDWRRLLKLPNRALVGKGFSPDVISMARRRSGIRAPGFRPGRWTAALVARLGKQSDASLARELGLDRSSVWAKRESLGIARWSPKRVWTAAETRWLGRLTDREIARRLGLSAETVGQKRRSLGIGCSPLSGKSGRPNERSAP